MKRIFLTIICLVALLPAMKAQEIDDRAAYYFNIDTDLWYNSSSAAGLAHSNMAQWRNVALGYEMASGSFTDAWDAQSKSRLSASGDMLMDIEGFKVAAKLDMGLGRNSRSRYNTSLYQVSWEMPYFVAVNTNEPFLWRRSDAALDVSAATPLFLDDRLSVGVNLKLDLQGATKRVNPGCRYLGMELAIMPSVTFAVSEENIVGLSLGYKLNPARSIVGAGESATTVLFHDGLGHASARWAGGDLGLSSIDYNTGAFAAALDYNHKGDVSDWLVELTFDQPTTKVTEKEFQGKVDQFLTGLSATGLFGESRSRKLSFSILHNLNAWQEGAKESPRATNNQIDASLGYTAYTDADSDHGFDWVFGLGADLHWMAYVRHFPDASFKNTRVMPNVLIGKNVLLAKEQSLLARLNLGYNFAAGTKYRYVSDAPGNYLVNYMYDSEADYMGAYYLSTTLAADYTYRFNSLITPYASLGTTLLTPMGDVKGVRFMLSFKLGVLF